MSLIWVLSPCGCSHCRVATDFFFFFHYLSQVELLTIQANQPAKREKNVPFPSTKKSHTLHQKTPVGVTQRGLEKRKKKSGSLAVYGAAREAARALHLTAPLSGPSLQPRTIPRCHLQLCYEFILSSNPRRRTGGWLNTTPWWTCRDRGNGSQMCFQIMHKAICKHRISCNIFIFLLVYFCLNI